MSAVSIGIGVAAIVTLAIIFYISRRHVRHIQFEELANKLYQIDQEAAANIADLWEADREHIRIGRREVLEAIGGKGGFRRLRSNVDYIIQALPDPAELAKSDPDLAETVTHLISDCREMRLYFDLAIAEDKLLSHLEVARPFHSAEAIWKYQSVVDLFYQLITQMNPQVVERLEFML